MTEKPTADQMEQLRRVLPKLADYIENMESLLHDLADHEDGDCRFDHHGYCQEHGWFATDPKCPIQRYKELMGKD